MNLKLVFRIFAGFGGFFALMTVIAPDAMVESYGVTLTDDSKLFLQFATLAQLMMVVIIWQIPKWLGENLAKAGTTMMMVALMPVAMNIYHTTTGVIPASAAQIGESVVWMVFAGLFYVYSKKSTDAPSDDAPTDTE